MSNKTDNAQLTQPPLGQLLVVAAPSGAGKSSLVNALLAQDPGISLSISDTTRSMRPGESEGSHYHFITHEQFEKNIDDGLYLEHARVYDNCYGTNRQQVARALSAGRDIILEIDWQGARQVLKQFPDACLVFFLPPSVEALRERLTKRGQDSEEVINRRMRDAQREMSHYDDFDYLIINDDFDTALAQLTALVQSLRLRTPVQQQRHKKLLEQLLQTR